MSGSTKPGLLQGTAHLDAMLDLFQEVRENGGEVTRRRVDGPICSWCEYGLHDACSGPCECTDPEHETGGDP